MNHIVLGLGYGDEGKGQRVSDLIASNPDIKMVVRFNSGHQAGHTVIKDGKRHVFSNFGAGTLQGIPTYWSQFCTIFPRAILNERDRLVELGYSPRLHIDPLCPVVTPFDIKANQDLEQTNQHGSVGVGFGATIARQEAYYKLFAQDLYYPSVLKFKLENIAKFYGRSINTVYTNETIKKFMAEVDELINTKGITVNHIELEKEDNIIYEGAQGVLLDMDFGFFPHVTRSNTTSKNALELIKNKENVVVNYVSRIYSTRHGYGPLSFEGYDMSYIRKNPDETNVSHQWQGEFRYAPLNLDLIQYAIGCDYNFSKGCMHHIKFTCLDQVDDVIPFVVDNEIKNLIVEEVIDNDHYLY